MKEFYYAIAAVLGAMLVVISIDAYIFLVRLPPGDGGEQRKENTVCNATIGTYLDGQTKQGRID
jgi:hypothetical protein